MNELRLPPGADVGPEADKVIHTLNERWDLRLPILPPHQTEAGPTASLATECSSKIWYLCARIDPHDIVTQSFEKSVRHLFSSWVSKLSQEKGTLPILPVTKSSLARDIDAKRNSGRVWLTDTERMEVVKILHKHLDEHCQLADLTDSYSIEQESQSSFATALSTPPRTHDERQSNCVLATHPRHHRPATPDTPEPPEPQLKAPSSCSAKRSIGSPSGKNKRQQSIRDFFRCEHPPAFPKDLRIPPDPTSFETNPSSPTSSILSNRTVENEPTSSHGTSVPTSGSWESQVSQEPLSKEELTAIAEDPGLRRSFNENNSPASPPDFTNIGHETYTPFRRKARLDPSIPFWCSWEIHRIATILDMLPIDVEGTLKARGVLSPPSFESFWHAVRDLCAEKGTRLPPKSALQPWTVDKNEYEDQESDRVAHFTGSLIWKKDHTKGLLEFRPNEIHLEQGCRLYRKFGADRFLVILAPDLSLYPHDNKMPLHQSGQEGLPAHIARFLTTKLHFIAGRQWRMFYIEEDKDKKSKNKTKFKHKLYFFAEKGSGICPQRPISPHCAGHRSAAHKEVTLEDLMAWHMPIQYNLDSTDLKLFSRWKLALSKTTPTVCLDPTQFRYLVDRQPVMNDGCALMSYSLALAIWEKCGGEGDLPSAVQGRIGGAKGLWLVDYLDAKSRAASEPGFWIQVSDSQLKIKPHPRDRGDADDHQRTFEVVKFATVPIEGRLNGQLITILEDHGVPRAHLRKLMVDDIESFAKELREAMTDPLRLLSFLQKKFNLRDRGFARTLGSLPAARPLQMQRLLLSGFRPEDSAPLMSWANDLLKDHLARYVEKFWIKVPHSTTVFCAPDPLGILNENEVHLRLSRKIKHPPTVGGSFSMNEFNISGIDILVARNPAHLSSDIQKRSAVDKDELRHYENVILFSTKGQTPLASLLSGGDYDGDEVFCCWDPVLVAAFDNTEKPSMPSEAECQLERRSRGLTDIFTGHRSPSEELRDFCQGCVEFNCHPSALGLCTWAHEQLVYSLGLRGHLQVLSREGPVKLAALAGYLVDSNKQGWSMGTKTFFALKTSVGGAQECVIPAFRSGERRPRSGDECLNVIDYLKFDVAEQQELQERVMFYEKWKYDKNCYDSTLSERWKSVDNQVPGQGGLDLILQDMLKGEGGLVSRIEQLKKRLPQTCASGGFDEDSVNDPKFSAAVRRLYGEYLTIEPKPVNHEIRHQYERMHNRSLSDWALLRASYLYYSTRQTSPKWVWFVAGEELCHLKALAYPGEVRLLVQNVHDILKVDPKCVRRFLEDSTEGHTGTRSTRNSTREDVFQVMDGSGSMYAEGS